MKLELFKKYVIRTDSMQYILYQKRPNSPFEIKLNDKGHEQFTNFYPPTYHSTFAKVLDKIKELEILNARAKTLDELREELDKIDEKIGNIEKKFK